MTMRVFYATNRNVLNENTKNPKKMYGHDFQPRPDFFGLAPLR